MSTGTNRHEQPRLLRVSRMGFSESNSNYTCDQKFWEEKVRKFGGRYGRGNSCRDDRVNDVAFPISLVCVCAYVQACTVQDGRQYLHSNTIEAIIASIIDDPVNSWFWDPNN